jgi:SAM-dependent methyltransferase
MMPDNPYHQIPYHTNPVAETHPDRLASVARLFGMTPAPATSCRVLEMGCGSGGNLIPMAYRLPASRFTGIDLAERAVAEGRLAARELGIENLHLIAMDLCDIGPAMGEFDYILAHGVYSWVPDDVRDRLLAVCRERLAPQGVAYVSFNALPGRYVRLMLRDMMLYHTRDCADAGERIQRARGLLQKLSEAHLVSSTWQPMVDDEIRQSLTGDPGWFFHDDLAPVNDSFYVRDFAAHAARHSLQYLGDGRPHLMFDTRASLDWVGSDVIEREQYFDFLCLRQFRQTLLCCSEVRLERPAGPERMDGFLFSSPAKQSDGKIEGFYSVCLVDPPEAVARVAAAMGAVFPLPVAFDQLFESAGDRDALRGILFTFISSGFAAFHTHSFAPVKSVSPRPRAHRLARWESARTGVVTYSNHTANKVDSMVRALIDLLDGTRELDEVASGLARVEGAPPLEEIRARLPQVLTHMAHTGLLEDY